VTIQVAKEIALGCRKRGGQERPPLQDRWSHSAISLCQHQTQRLVSDD